MAVRRERGEHDLPARIVHRSGPGPRGCGRFRCTGPGSRHEPGQRADGPGQLVGAVEERTADRAGQVAGQRPLGPLDRLRRRRQDRVRLGRDGAQRPAAPEPSGGPDLGEVAVDIGSGERLLAGHEEALCGGVQLVGRQVRRLDQPRPGRRLRLRPAQGRPGPGGVDPGRGAPVPSQRRLDRGGVGVEHRHPLDGQPGQLRIGVDPRRPVLAGRPGPQPGQVHGAADHQAERDQLLVRSDRSGVQQLLGDLGDPSEPLRPPVDRGVRTGQGADREPQTGLDQRLVRPVRHGGQDAGRGRPPGPARRRGRRPGPR